MLNIAPEYWYNPLQTPHSGYHWDGTSERFFEGWYFRVTIPEIAQTFAFMYSIEDPIGKRKNSGGAVQILGIDEEYMCRTFPNTDRFWAANNSLALGHWGKSNLNCQPQLLHPAKFEHNLQQGYQVTSRLNQGYIFNPGNDNYCRWLYQIKPIYGWGNPDFFQEATAGLLSYFSIFEPGWQVLMAHGLARGWIDWKGKVYQFVDAPAYSEKNWGCSFPNKWFWINCNSFKEENNLSLTAVGSSRKVLGYLEEVGIIGIHYQNKFYQFAPWNSQITWQVLPWGRWQMQATKGELQVLIIGSTKLSGNYVRVPTEQGLIFGCRDTTKGELRLELDKKNGDSILKANSSVAGLEIGGSSWNSEYIIS